MKLGLQKIKIFCDEKYFQVLDVPAQHALLGRPGPLRPGAGEEESLSAAEREPAYQQAPDTN